jgi:hypothetical protein
MITFKKCVPVLCAFGLLATAAFGQGLSADVKAKVDAKAKQLMALGSDAAVVSAVKAYNADPSAEAKAMTNDKWKQLTVLDPFVRSLSKNPLAVFLKSKQDEQIAECFVSGADGTKVGFLSKTTSWSHADKDKHRVPMTGKVWTGPQEMDESTGQLQVQVGIPVLDGGKPIGSLVVGLKVAKL